MQDSTTPATPIMTPSDAQTPTPATQPMPASGLAPEPKKSKTGLIIGIIIAILIIIAIVALIIILNNKPKTDEQTKTDVPSANVEPTKPEESDEDAIKLTTKDGEMTIDIDGETVTIKKNFKDAAESFLDAGYVIKYQDEDSSEETIIAKDNFDKFFKQTTENSAYVTLNISVENIGKIRLDGQAVWSGMLGRKPMPYSNMQIARLILPAHKINLNNKTLDVKNADYDTLKSFFNKDSDSTRGLVYIYKNIGKFDFAFHMNNEKVSSIYIAPTQYGDESNLLR